ncbi:MAG TPA: TadE/TadG family type IV pilus assembly protein [Baekduia sp.]
MRAGETARGERSKPSVAVARSARLRSAARGARGQSSVEMVGLIPLLVLVVLVAAQFLAAGAARSVASSAAQAAAMAIVQGGDPADAARAAAPGWAHARLDVRISGRRAVVRATPATVLPLLPGALASTARADAGPAS